MGNTYTLTEAVESCIGYLIEQGVILTMEAREQVASRFMGGCRYGERICCDVPIQSLRGKGTRKYAHIVVERLDSGRYEPIAYVL